LRLKAQKKAKEEIGNPSQTDVQNLFNKYVKQRDTAIFGKFCMDCREEVIMTYKDVQNRAEACHFISRSVAPNLSLFVNNVYMCCHACNMKHSANDTAHFSEKINLKIDTGTTQWLLNAKLKGLSLMKFDRRVLFVGFKKMIEDKTWTYDVPEVVGIMNGIHL